MSTGAGVDIVWADGHRSHYDFAYLRESVPARCATTSAHKKPDTGAASIQTLSQILCRCSSLTPRARRKGVGNYALQIDFSDGHTAGIYSFDYLRTICPCEECAKSSAPARRERSHVRASPGSPAPLREKGHSDRLE